MAGSKMEATAGQSLPTKALPLLTGGRKHTQCDCGAILDAVYAIHI